MKLELKHLAPYLPYGLKIWNRGEYSDTENNIIQQFEMVGLGSFVEYHEIGRTVTNENYYLDVFPILKPLPFKDFASRDYTYNELEFFLKNHFDIFGLIENGLAIDINTLNK